MGRKRMNGEAKVKILAQRQENTIMKNSAEVQRVQGHL